MRNHTYICVPGTRDADEKIIKEICFLDQLQQEVWNDSKVQKSCILYAWKALDM